MKRKTRQRRIPRSLKLAQIRFDQALWSRKFEIQKLKRMRYHFDQSHPAHLILEFKVREKIYPEQNIDEHLPAILKAKEDLSRLQCLCPSVDMDISDLTQVEKELDFNPAPSTLPEMYSQILLNPYSIFLDLVFSGEDLVEKLSELPIKKDQPIEHDFGEEIPINLEDDLALSNAIFLTHFDLNLFCEQVTQEKFNIRMNLKEFAEFEQKFVYDQKTSFRPGVVNIMAYRFGSQIYMIQEVLKHTQTLLKILHARFFRHPRWSGSYYPRFFSDRPTMMFYSS